MCVFFCISRSTRTSRDDHLPNTAKTMCDLFGRTGNLRCAFLSRALRPFTNPKTVKSRRRQQKREEKDVLSFESVRPLRPSHDIQVRRILDGTLAFDGNSHICGFSYVCIVCHTCEASSILWWPHKRQESV